MVPTQEAHAKRLLEACAHIRQIRFELCPKRIKDEEFWQVEERVCVNKIEQEGVRLTDRAVNE